MSPAFERRLARIDKAFDRLRAAREAEEARLGLARFYLNMAMVHYVTERFGPEAAAWVLGDPETPEPRAAQILDSPQRHRDTEGAGARPLCASLSLW